MTNTQKGIGSHDATAIMGVNQRKSRIQLFLEKVGQAEPRRGHNEAVYWGQRMKDSIADEFVSRTGFQIEKVDIFRRHPEHDFMIGTASYLFTNDEGNQGILDVRTVSEYKRKEWDLDKIPMDAYIRVHHNMAVFDHQIGAVAVLIGGNTFVHRIIERNQVMIDEIINAEKAFWHHVETNTMPEMDGSKAAEAYLSEEFEEVEEGEMELPKEAFHLIEEFNRAREEEAAAAEAKRAASNKLKALIGHKTLGRIGTSRVMWKPVTQKRLDSKRLQADHPDIYDKFTKETTYRRFQIK